MPVAQKYRYALLLALPAAAAALLYHGTLERLFVLWFDDNNPSYTHGWLLLLVCIYYFYQGARRVAPQQLGHSLSGLALVALSALGWFIARAANIQLGEFLAFFLLLYGLYRAMFGAVFARHVTFPFLLIIGALPVWDVFGAPLQQITVVSVDALLNATGILALRDGFLLQINEGVFEVAPGCSGQRFFVVAIVLAVIMGRMFGATVRRTLLYVALAVLMSILMNILRVYIIVLSGHLTDMQHYFVTTDHVSLGWALFLVGMVALWFIIDRAGWFPPVGRGDTGGAVAAAGPVAGMSGRRRAVIAAALTLTVSAPLLTLFMEQALSRGHAATLQLPARFAGWAMAPAPGDWHPDYAGGDLQRQKYYKQGVNGVYLYLNYYLAERQGSEAVNDINRVYDDQNWHLREQRDAAVAIPEKDDIVVRESVIENNRHEFMLVWEWYYANGAHTAQPLQAKLNGLLADVRLRPWTAVIILAIPLSDTADMSGGSSVIDQARDQLTAFTGQALAGLERTIDNAYVARVNR